VLLLALASALAAPPDVLHDDSIARAISGDCPGAEPGLRRRVDALPDDLGARLALDACRYSGTERDIARTDLLSLYRVSAPYDPGVLLKSRESKAADVAYLRREAQMAFETLLRAMVDKKAFEDAQLALASLEPMVGESGPTAASRLLLEHAQNGVKAIWPLATASLARFPDDADVIEEVARVVFDDGAHAPKEVLDAIFTRGRTSAKLNALLGLLRADRAADCLTRADTFRVAEADRDKLPPILYRCAVAAKDTARADTIVAAGTKGLDARVIAAHARLRLEAGREAEALALVEPLAPKEAAAVGVVLEVYARQGDTAKIDALARELPAGSTARLTAASTLVTARKYGAALLLVEGTCGTYTGADATSCTRIVDAAHHGLGK